MFTIAEWKTKCHGALEIYIHSTLRVTGDKKHYMKMKRKAYHRLAKELHTDVFKAHFANMQTVGELQKAYRLIIRWLNQGTHI